MIKAITVCSVTEQEIEKVLTIVIITLEEASFEKIQDCVFGKNVCSKLPFRYLGNIRIDKNVLLHFYLIIKFRQNANIEDNAATVVLQLSRLMSMKFAIEKQLKNALLTNALSVVGDVRQCQHRYTPL